jgi:uncharacterized protein
MTHDSPEQTSQESPDPDLAAFAQVCETLMRFEGDTDASYADGYLTAIAASRRIIEVDEWLPALTGEAFGRAFADPQAAEQATRALDTWLLRRREELNPERLLDHPDQSYITPLFDEWTDEMRAELIKAGEVAPEEVMTLQTGCLWSQGFLACLEDFAEEWPSPDEGDDGVEAESYRMMTQLIGCLSLSPDDDEYKAFVASQWRGDPPTRDELLDEVCYAVQDLRLYWLDHGPKPEQRIVGDKPGRNDPCPCGSGRKYKKCHGA